MKSATSMIAEEYRIQQWATDIQACQISGLCPASHRISCWKFNGAGCNHSVCRALSVSALGPYA
jgi:hypothetical protein